MTGQERYSIKIASKRTGLTPHVIRIWERRYGAVKPERTDTNRRLYSEAELQRLGLLARATRAGHSISNLVPLSDERLAELLKREGHRPPALPEHANGADPAPFLDRSVRAAASLDTDALAEELEQASLVVGQPVLLEKLVVPLLHQLGALWERGEIKVAHEHPASAVVRTFLGNLLSQYAPAEEAPAVVVTTLTGQQHELGALMAALTAAAQGWRPVYMGPDLPAEEIAAAVQQTRARAVAVSLVYPPDDSRVPSQLSRLRRLIADDVRILAGGRVAPRYASALNAIGASTLSDIAGLRQELNRLRRL